MADRTVMLVLHTLRLTGAASAEVVAGRLGDDRVVIDTLLGELEGERFVRFSAGALEGWVLTPAGRARGEALLAAELDELDARPALEAVHEEFVTLNPGVLRVCSDWQVRAPAGDPASTGALVLNDHGDPAYDAEVLDRLGALHARAAELLAAAGTALERFAPYPARLDNALARARAGGLEWVTRPQIDSYHTVWFELHEDLLATLGRRRADERENDAAG